MPTILITAFEPFGELPHNPSQDLVDAVVARHARGELIAEAEHGPLTIVEQTLPVVFGRASAELTTAVATHHPDVVIALGLAAGTEAVRFERVGLNLRDARIPDNAGQQPADEPVVDGAPAALFTSLRVKAAHARLTAAGITVKLSLSAGSYLCNEVLYSVLHLTQHPAPEPGTGPAHTRAGFVHIPDLRAPGSPVSTEQAATAVDVLIAETLHPGPDLVTTGGSLH